MRAMLWLYFIYEQAAEMQSLFVIFFLFFWLTAKCITQPKLLVGFWTCKYKFIHFSCNLFRITIYCPLVRIKNTCNFKCDHHFIIYLCYMYISSWSHSFALSLWCMMDCFYDKTGYGNIFSRENAKNIYKGFWRKIKRVWRHHSQ